MSRSFFQAYLPPDVEALCGWTTLRRESIQHVDDALRDDSLQPSTFTSLTFAQLPLTRFAAMFQSALLNEGMAKATQAIVVNLAKSGMGAEEIARAAAIPLADVRRILDS